MRPPCLRDDSGATRATIIVAWVCCAVAFPVGAADLTVDVLFDLDRDALTGCAASSADGNLPGIELRLRTTVDDTTAAVTNVTYAHCVVPASDTFGAETPVSTVVAPPWDVVVGNGTSGATLVETVVPLSILPRVATADAYVVVFGVPGSDALSSPDGADPLGGIPVGLAGPEVPSLSWWGIAVLIALLGLIAVFFAPRAIRNPLILIVVLGSSVLNPTVGRALLGEGMLRIWEPDDEVAVDPAGDAPEGVDIVEMSTYLDLAQDVLFIRVDVFLGPSVCLEWGMVDPGTGFPCKQEPPPDQGPFSLQVAMTFDDGPNPATTPSILSILRANNIPATFFMRGDKLGGAAADALALEIHQDPLFRVANHSFSHADFKTLTAQEISDELNSTSELIREAVGDACYFPPYFRFPRGRSDCFSMEEVRKHGFGVAGVNIDPVDWCYAAGGGFCSPSQAPWVPAIYQNDLPGYAVTRLLAAGGGIMLMHDIHANTVAELPAVISAFQAQGATFVDLADPTLFPIINGNINPPEPPACCDGVVN